MLGSSRVAAQLADSREGLSSVSDDDDDDDDDGTCLSKILMDISN
jgi:hypothetical protein